MDERKGYVDSTTDTDTNSATDIISRDMALTHHQTMTNSATDVRDYVTYIVQQT